ncbi:MAG: reverse transcriptase domain-containing protein, partial [Anaerolineae bacterium]
RLEHDLPVRRVEVYVLAIDPNPNMLALYQRLIPRYARVLKSDMLHVKVETAQGKFPQDFRSILRTHTPNNRHVVIMVMSNFVRDLHDMYKHGTTRAQARVQSLLRGDDQYAGVFGEAEGICIKEMIGAWDLDRVCLLSVATKKPDSIAGPDWDLALHDFGNGILGTTQPHYCATRRVECATRISYVNPRACHWRRVRNRRSGYSDFYHSEVAVTANSFKTSEQWQAVMEEDNLMLAWARTRRHALDEALADQMEVKLVDHDIEGRLARLRNRLLARDWDCLNVGGMWIFGAPKNALETRPKAIVRLEESILGAAIVQRLGVAFNRRQRVSFSHRLNDRADEYLYEYWFRRYRLFRAQTRRLAAPRGQVLKSDISRFYQKVDQEYLIQIIARELGLEERVQQALKRTIVRDFPQDHDPGLGLPQGHVASGFWANMYLSQVDQAFRELEGVDFARYADDMVFAISRGQAPTTALEKSLRQTVSAPGLGLELSDDKTFPQSAEEYIKQTEDDSLLDELQQEFKRLTEMAYPLPEDHRQVYDADRWGFLEKYRELLAAVKLYPSTEWLARKVHQFRMKETSLGFPAYPAATSDIPAWKRDFRQLNTDWVVRLDRFRKRLERLCLAAVENLDDPNVEQFYKEIQKRRLKFSINRLSVLGLDAVADRVAEEIIRRPWLVPVSLACAGLSYCGRGDLLCSIVDHSGSAYCRAVALRALAPQAGGSRIRQRLWSTVFSTQTQPCEKLKASESLLVADCWEDACLEHCISLISTKTDPYLLKNYVLVAGRAFKQRISETLASVLHDCPHPIVAEAIQFLVCSDFANLAIAHEPDALIAYYADYYPDAQSDAKDQDASEAGWVPR